MIADWRLIGQCHVRKLRADYADASRVSSAGFVLSDSPVRHRRTQVYQSSRHGYLGTSPHLSVSGWSLHITMHEQDRPTYEHLNGRRELKADGGWQCILTWYKNFERILFNGMIRDGKLLQGRISNRYLFFIDYKVLLVRFLYLLPNPHSLVGNKEGLGIRRGWTDPSLSPIRHLVRTSLPTARPHADCRSRVGLRRRKTRSAGHCN